MLTIFVSSAFAEHVINTETNTWKSVPITVDEDSNTYTLDDAYLIPEGNYYYSFPGYRCLTSQSSATSEKPLVLKPSSTKKSNIYCYKDSE